VPPRASEVHWSSVAPSSLTQPRAGVQTPTSERASDDLPEALGPMTPKALPAIMEKETPLTTARFSPGGTMEAFSTVRVATGGRSGKHRSRSG
jgi:hypothetical protein